MKLKNSIGFKINMTANLLNRYMAASCGEILKAEFEVAEISASALRILGFIREKGDEPVFQKDIEEAFNIRRATASKILATMEKNHMITRSSIAEDKRLKKITLTPKMLETQTQFRSHAQATEEKILHGITPQEQEAIVNILDKIIKNIE